MSIQADEVRTRRQRFAAPGGTLDRAVKWLAVLLPALIGAMAASMIIAPLSPRGEISFLLDRNKVATAGDRLRVDEAVYRGADQRGRPFSLSAGEAVQRSASVPVVQMSDLTARLQLEEGPAVLTAPAGNYNIRQERVAVDGVVRFLAADGYRMALSGVTIDLPGRRLTGADGIEGSLPAGTFRADSVLADLGARTVTLSGNARLRMVPGQMRMP
ncbi:MAG: LPS export ABC transporter periplasmic protein LptC [Sphingomonadales bacterium 32-68-7]|nr:MAG: LPS export ABC transporter periplasmic protein LptC [Sphingomonadales bacterium 12-68-11]OYX09497.1 MAG: LPS export ABC transporter periplasmic protein LptC [Sphingomonadales bacterium 32-68-7]